MCSQLKSSYSYKFSMLASSFRFLFIGAAIFLGASFYVYANNMENNITAAISVTGLVVFLYGATIGIFSIPITLYRLVRYQEDEGVTEPVHVAAELTDTAKKARFLKREKEWIALEAKRVG